MAVETATDAARVQVATGETQRKVLLSVVMPVYNEEAVLAGSVHRLHRYLRDNFTVSFRITIADNASADATPVIAATSPIRVGQAGASPRIRAPSTTPIPARR